MNRELKEHPTVLHNNILRSDYFTCKIIKIMYYVIDYFKKIKTFYYFTAYCVTYYSAVLLIRGVDENWEAKIIL